MSEEQAAKILVQLERLNKQLNGLGWILALVGGSMFGVMLGGGRG